MSWNYRRRIKIIPGVHLNISKSGVSTSIGVPGASLTFAKDGTYLNAGIPGSGIYNRSKISNKDTNQNDLSKENLYSQATELTEIFSKSPQAVTSQDMVGLKDTILASREQIKELKIDLTKVSNHLGYSKVKLAGCYIFLYGLIKKSIRYKITNDILLQRRAIKEIKNQIEDSSTKLDIQFDGDILAKYEKVVEAFNELCKSRYIWDVTHEIHQDTKITRSSASTLIKKVPIKIGVKPVQDIKSNFDPLWLQNANGADIYFYPGFVMAFDSKDKFGIIGFNEIDILFNSVRFIENGNVPPDAQIVDRTWHKVNKNGSPDRRFKDNFQIPVLEYGSMRLKSKSGISEEYYFSNNQAMQKFGRGLNEFVKLLKY